LTFNQQKPQVGVIYKGISSNLLISETFYSNSILPFDKVIYFIVGLVFAPSEIPIFLYYDSMNRNVIKQNT